MSADMGGTSDGTSVRWELPPEPCAGPDGQSGEPPCPLLTANLLVDPATPEGTVITNTLTLTDHSGAFLQHNTKTTIGTFKLSNYRMLYPRKLGRDRVTYRGVFTLSPGDSIDPDSELFRIQVATAFGQQILDLQLAPGQLRRVTDGRWVFTSRDPGLSRVLLSEAGPSHYRLTLGVGKMELPPPSDLDLIVTFTFGDDVLSQPLSLLVLRGGKKFLGVQ
jgi:hypothetical protein